MDKAVRHAIAILACFALVSLKAQTYLNRLIDFNDYEVGGGVILTDSCYYIYGIAGPPMVTEGFISKVDLLGDTIWIKKIPVDSMHSWNTTQGLFTKLPDESLIIGGAVRGPGIVGYDNQLSRWNSEGDTLWTQIWGVDTLSDIIRTMVVLDSSRIAVFGSRYNPTLVRGGIYYTLFDTNGIILLDTMVTGFGYFDDPSSATLLPNGNMAVLFRRNKLKPMFEDDHDLMLLEVRIDGTIVRQVEFDSPFRAYGGSVSMNGDNSLIIVSGTEEVVPYWDMDPLMQGYIAVLDTNFTILFDTLRGYGTSRTAFIWSHIILDNGDAIFLGGVRPGIGTGTAPSQGWIFRMDTTFRILWSRLYTTLRYNDHYLYDLKEDADGNLVAVGSGYAQTQDLWIIRTDSAGCLVPNCDSLTWAGPEHQPFAVQVYPNPFGSQFTIALPPAAARASVTVNDLSGRMIYTAHSIAGTHHISAHAWPPGLYMVKVATTEGVWSGKVVKVE